MRTTTCNPLHQSRGGPSTRGHRWCATGRLYGRGAADDKSGIAVHAATLQTMRAVYGDALPVGLRVVIEGEEETQSHLGDFVRANPALFTADVFVIADGGNEQVGVPVLEVTTRGAVVLTIEVKTLEQPVHSGIFGGAAPDALMALIRVLATLHDDDGNVAVSGLHRDTWAGADTSEDLFRRAGGLLPGVPLVGTGTLAGRLWAEPAVNVIGLDAAPTEGAVNALAPSARAIVSLRTPPGADPDREQQLLIDHLTGSAPWGVEVNIVQADTWPGWSTSQDGPAFSTARAAMADAFGAPVNVIGSGGSIPLLNVLSEISPDGEFVLWGLSDGESSNLHSADESVDLAELRRIAESQVLFLSRLASVSPPRGHHGPVSPHPFLQHPGPIPMVHRGAPLTDDSSLVENTTAAFQRAYDRGFRYFETDVHCTEDGVVVASARQQPSPGRR